MSQTQSESGAPVTKPDDRNYLNIAAYRFTSIAQSELASLRNRLKTIADEAQLKGTILLSPEGINLFVAGRPDSVQALIDFLNSDPRFAGMELKRSLSAHQPYNRMLVRLKKEIIAFGVDAIDPENRPSPKLSPRQLKQWLDNGDEITLLDVRNDYEIGVGTFRNAVSLGIESFRDFPDVVQQRSSELRGQPLVMFCTGGIRCEKAGPYMQQLGFDAVYQLDGGILRYFEECGAAHYDGDCFVFDKRVSVDAELQETDTAQCYACQAILTPDDQSSEKYVAGHSCPYCYESPIEKLQKRLLERHVEIAQLTSPLPGSVPQDNARPLNVPQKYDGWPLIDFLVDFHPHIERAQWKSTCENGQIQYRDHSLECSQSVFSGQQLIHLVRNEIEPPVNAAIHIVHEDGDVIAVDKPAPLPMHPSGQFNRNTLVEILKPVYKPRFPRILHRLDANTSGLVLLALNRRSARHLNEQFVEQRIGKRYLAEVTGVPKHDRFSCDIAIDRRPGGAAGRREVSESGVAAETRFEVLARDQKNNRSLILCTPVTGRTNQIRAHLWYLQIPAVGDPMYLPLGQTGNQQTLGIDAPEMRLHSCGIRFVHPGNDQRICLTSLSTSWIETIEYCDRAALSSVVSASTNDA